MSRELLKSYERDFEQCMGQLRGILDDPSRAKLITTSKKSLDLDLFRKPL